ncbi:Crp/Fnr family transcriptional regulator [Pedobacter mucosus]|uniref:Crp/Fnr family transcriptional regulator n=1 Tax=Pedobacter mucosus TaxID=2895286 RepID=UPI001EE40D65|nr:Crp/Fnr family transcriptional regulator [Pedobacter mucosus]UKT64896.1 Crp/Fnr family transcriptional regulator [Pedobacter mucosus]
MERLKAVINGISPMSREDIDLLPPGIVVSVKKKCDLLEQGNVCKNISFVTKGFFRMFYVDMEGNEINNRFTEADNFIVDFQSFLTQRPSRYYWQAMQDSEVLTFTFNDVQKLYATSPAWGTFGRLVAEQVYLQLNERVEMFQFMSPQQRYEYLLSTRPELFNQISQFHLSSYLGVKPESLSRLRKRLLYR